ASLMMLDGHSALRHFGDVTCALACSRKRSLPSCRAGGNRCEPSEYQSRHQPMNCECRHRLRAPVLPILNREWPEQPWLLARCFQSCSVELWFVCENFPAAACRDEEYRQGPGDVRNFSHDATRVPDAPHPHVPRALPVYANDQAHC